MSEIKFACPSCQQHIQCDPSYGGMQIDCPACHAKMIVPGEAPAPAQVSVAATTPPAGNSCPECNSLLSPAAVMCTNCGFNLRTGQRMPAQAPPPAGAKKKKKKKRRPGADPYQEKWYASPWPYIGVLALVFGLLFYLGKKFDGAMLAFLGLAALYTFGMHITVAIHAFKNEGVGWAFLCFCIPFVALYYVYKRTESPLLQALYGLAIILNITLRFLDLDTMGEGYGEYPEDE